MSETGSVTDAAALEFDIADQSPVGITVCDASRDGRPVVYANERFLELTGFDRSAILGRNWLALQGRATRAEAVERVRDAVRAGESVTVDLRLYRADGDPFWDRVRVTPVTDGGKVSHFVGFHEDVTAEKQREGTLEALHGVATRMQDEETVDGVCDRTVSAAADLLEFDLCTVVVRDGEWLVPRATSAETPPDGSRRMRIDQGLAGETYQTGES